MDFGCCCTCAAAATAAAAALYAVCLFQLLCSAFFLSISPFTSRHQILDRELNFHAKFGHPLLPYPPICPFPEDLLLCTTTTSVW